jgi:hypothetical protein
MFEGQPQDKVDAMMKADAEFRQLLQRHRKRLIRKDFAAQQGSTGAP